MELAVLDQESQEGHSDHEIAKLIPQALAELERIRRLKKQDALNHRDGQDGLQNGRAKVDPTEGFALKIDLERATEVFEGWTQAESAETFETVQSEFGPVASDAPAAVQAPGEPVLSPASAAPGIAAEAPKENPPSRAGDHDRLPTPRDPNSPDDPTPAGSNELEPIDELFVALRSHLKEVYDNREGRMHRRLLSRLSKTFRPSQR